MKNNVILIRAIVTFILGIIFGLALQANCDAAEPHADSVYFDSATDLIAKMKSVIGVCDTTWWTPRFNLGIPDNSVIDSAVISVTAKNPLPLDSILAVAIAFYPYDITCRELVTMTVVKHPEWSIATWGQSMIPGLAIIWWRPYGSEGEVER